MIIIFGWLKETLPVKSLLSTYCYHCNNHSSWLLLKETEWATFFYMKTMPFMSKYFIACERCKDIFELNKQLTRGINRLGKLNELERNNLHDQLVSSLEKYQLSNKNERQLEFIRSMQSANGDRNA